jgi:muramoyltetrapeptide carboxypeptidase
MLKKPEPLKPGDRVALAAPSSPVSPLVLETSIASINFLGLEPVIMPSCHMRHGYLSAPDRQRADDINKAFADPSIKGIFCLRGGFGATRLLPLLDYPMIRQTPKAFIGYSDITALHTAFNQLCGFITFHGPMPNTSYSRMASYSLDSLKQNLFSSRPPGMVINPDCQPLKAVYPGTAQGMITGGNLSLLQGTLGSPYEVDTKGKILFLEDVGERPYRLDKALTALSLAGKFRDCAGVILGTFTECEEPAADTVPPNTRITGSSLTIREIIDEVIRPWGKPTISNFRAGHVDPQSTIPLGIEACFDTSSMSLRFG